MTRQGFSHLGSGTVPYIEDLQNNDDPSKRYRDGSQVIVVNPEDFSVFRNGDCYQVSLASSTATRLDKGLENRRAVAIANLSSTETIYVGFNDTVSLTGVNGGFPIFPQTSISLDATNRMSIYAISASALDVSVMEVA